MSFHRGAALTELAIVVPLLVIVFTGLIYAGMAISESFTTKSTAYELAMRNATLPLSGQSGVSDSRLRFLMTARSAFFRTRPITHSTSFFPTGPIPQRVDVQVTTKVPGPLLVGEAGVGGSVSVPYLYIGTESLSGFTGRSNGSSTYGCGGGTGALVASCPSQVCNCGGAGLTCSDGTPRFCYG